MIEYMLKNHNEEQLEHFHKVQVGYSPRRRPLKMKLCVDTDTKLSKINHDLGETITLKRTQNEIKIINELDSEDGPIFVLNAQGVFQCNASITDATWNLKSQQHVYRDLKWLHALEKHTKQGKKTLKDFKSVETIGIGAFGEVDLMEDSTTQEQYAVKKITLGNEKDYVAFRELKALATLLETQENNGQDSGLISFYQVFYEDGIMYLFEEYMNQKSLETIVEPRSTDEMKNIAAQLITGMNRLHEMNLLHRDIKPANVVADNKGKAKLTDFGFCIPPTTSSEVTSQQFQSDMLIRSLAAEGTMNFMSRSRIEGVAATPACDRFSMGLTLFILANGGHYPSYLEVNFFDRVTRLGKLAKAKNPAMLLLQSPNLPTDFELDEKLLQLINDCLRGDKVEMNHPFFENEESDHIEAQEQKCALKESKRDRFTYATSPILYHRVTKAVPIIHTERLSKQHRYLRTSKNGSRTPHFERISQFQCFGFVT